MCKYIKKELGEFCQERPYQNSDYCILHMDYPPEIGSNEFVRIYKLKKFAFKKRLKKRRLDFEGVKIHYVTIKNFGNEDEENNINFDFAQIYGLHIEGKCFLSLCMKEANVNKSIDISNAFINGGLAFYSVSVGWHFDIGHSKVKDSIVLDRVNIGYQLFIVHSDLGGLRLDGSEISEDIEIENSKIGYISLDAFKVGGKILLKKNRIPQHYSEEIIYRAARISVDNHGDRILGDRYFYKEMVAKRKQKNLIVRITELPIQIVFRYGTSWYGIILTWFFVIFLSAIFYWIGKGLLNSHNFWDCLYFSTLSSLNIANGHYQLTNNYSVLATFEVIVGIFMWTALIAVFSRKYMR